MSLTLSLAFEEKLFEQINELNLSLFGQKILGTAQRTEKKVRESFDAYISKPIDHELAYKAALKLLRKEQLTRKDYNLIAGILSRPIRENDNRAFIETDWMSVIIDYFKGQYARESLSIIGWIQLLAAYFAIDPNNQSAVLARNKETIRLFLKETHQYFFLRKKFEPGAFVTLRNHANLLSADPCRRYVTEFLNNDQSELDEIRKKLPIQPNSWFFQQLIFSIVEYVTRVEDDAGFKSKISDLIAYLGNKKDNKLPAISTAIRDNAIRLIINRYYQCTDRSLHKELCEYIINPLVWKSPKLRDTNILSEWNSIDEKVWRMIRSWVNRENLRVFFEILSKKHGADKGRFKFWINYVDQIEYTRFIFGRDSIESKKANIRQLISEEQGVSSYLDSTTRDLDAFIIQIRGHTFVEFSMMGNAAFLYRDGKLPFLINSTIITHEQLGRGGKNVHRFIHRPGWEQRLEKELLEEFGIFPDKPHKKAKV